MLRNLVADTLLLILILELFLGEDAPELPKVAVVALAAGAANLVISAFLNVFGPLIVVPTILVIDGVILTLALWLGPQRAAAVVATFAVVKIVLGLAAFVVGRFFW